MERQGLSTSALLILTLTLAFSLSACTSVFFQPNHVRYPYLELDRLSAQTTDLYSRDGTKLAAWILKSTDARKNHPEIVRVADLKPTETRGVALQFHGNAENMSSHYRFQLWLLFEGWDVLTFDYRGYGDSKGTYKDLGGVRDDGVAALMWANAYAQERNLPLVVFGQSLGASILLSALEKIERESTPPLRPPLSQLDLLVIDSAFYSYRSIAREKLSDVWFLWPFQALGWLLVSNDLSSAHAIERTPAAFTIPAIFLHSENDPVVSSSQGERLFAFYPGPKERWTTKEPGHVNTLFADVYVDKGDTTPKSKTREKLKAKLREISTTAATAAATRGETKPPSK